MHGQTRTLTKAEYDTNMLIVVAKNMSCQHILKILYVKTFGFYKQTINLMSYTSNEITVVVETISPHKELLKYYLKVEIPLS